MSSHRNLEDDMHEMVCSLRIDADVLKHPLEYKYVIFSPKMTEDNECYEKLHYFQYDDPNRCLKMSPQALHSAYGGTCMYIYVCKLFCIDGLDDMSSTFI